MIGIECIVHVADSWITMKFCSFLIFAIKSACYGHSFFTSHSRFIAFQTLSLNKKAQRLRQSVFLIRWVSVHRDQTLSFMKLLSWHQVKGWDGILQSSFYPSVMKWPPEEPLLSSWHPLTEWEKAFSCDWPVDQTTDALYCCSTSTRRSIRWLEMIWLHCLNTNTLLLCLSACPGWLWAQMLHACWGFFYL